MVEEKKEFPIYRNWISFQTFLDPGRLGFANDLLPEPEYVTMKASEFDPAEGKDDAEKYGARILSELEITIEPPFGRQWQYWITFDSSYVPSYLVKRFFEKLYKLDYEACASHSFYSEDAKDSGHTYVDKDGNYEIFHDIFPETYGSKVLEFTAIEGGKGSVPDSWLPFVGPIDDFVTPKQLLYNLNIRFENPNQDTGQLTEDITSLIETFPGLNESQ